MALDNNFGLRSLGRLNRLVGLESVRYEISKTKIFMGMIKLFARCRIGPNYYLLAGFADPRLSFEEKTRHLNNKGYHKCVDSLNPREYRKITQNKLSEKAYLKFINAPISDFIAYWSSSGSFDNGSGSDLKSLVDLDSLLAEHIGEKLCFKLIEGWGGKGFLAGEVVMDNGGSSAIRKLFSDEMYSIEDIVSHFKQYDSKGSFLIESYIRQDIFYSKFNKTSLNTVRMWTLEMSDGRIETIGANFRIGREGSLTDNGDGGGIMCPVDVETGVLGPGIFTDTPFREEMNTHPDTNAPITDVKLKGWMQIKEICEDTLLKIPQTRFAGFDIAMSNDGPVIVEVNVCPDKDGAAYGKCPSRILLDNL